MDCKTFNFADHKEHMTLSEVKDEQTEENAVPVALCNSSDL